VIVVILADFLFADIDMRADFAADDPLREQSVSNIVLEIFPVAALRRDRLLQIFHAVDLVLLSQLIEPLDHFRLYVESHVFAALD